jgi:1-aminocyclopropane-1-carboxylate deaminase/D-cysteine desulfhydrase-like pyridoxal-dependent ACC family enzyme
VGRAAASHAAAVVRASSRAGLPLALARAWLRAGRMGPRRWIPGGGAHARAVLGHVLATLELQAQLPAPPDAVVLPLGTGGTAAGVALGIAALGWPTRVIAVRVAPWIVANRWRVGRLARGAARLLTRSGIEFRIPHSALRIDVVDGVGEGYGHPTPAGEAARALTATHGLMLESTYGAKAFAVLLERATWNVQRAVFWHTFAVP